MTVGRAGESWRRSASSPTPGVVGFSDDGSPVRSASILRDALAYAGALGLPIVDHPEDADADRRRRGERRASSRRSSGCAAGRPRPRRRPSRATSRSSPTSCATCPAPGCTSPTSRRPARSSSSGARRRPGLPVTCDVTPHHLALTDEWIAGARRWAWEAERRPVGGRARSSRRPYAPSLRVNPPLRAPEDAAACLAALARRHGRRDRHRPRAAHRGRQGGRVRAGGERDQRHRDGAGPRARRGRRGPAAARSRDRGADDRPGAGPRRPVAARRRRSGSSRARRRTSSSSIARSAGRSPPRRSRRAARTRRCSGWSWPGRVLLTIAAGRIAYEAPDA